VVEEERGEPGTEIVCAEGCEGGKGNGLGRCTVVGVKDGEAGAEEVLATGAGVGRGW